MPKLRLSEADQQRLGVDGDLPIDVNTITNREAIELAKVGYPTPWLFQEALRTKAEHIDIVAWTAMVWLALRRAGIVTDLETLEFDLLSLDYIRDTVVEVAAPEGKAPDPEASTNSTRPRSRRTATSKAR